MGNDACKGAEDNRPFALIGQLCGRSRVVASGGGDDLTLNDAARLRARKENLEAAHLDFRRTFKMIHGRLGPLALVSC